jgi:hypothetical protein
VGLPGSPVGLQKEDPTIADMLKPLGHQDLAIARHRDIALQALHKQLRTNQEKTLCERE